MQINSHVLPYSIVNIINNFQRWLPTVHAITIQICHSVIPPLFESGLALHAMGFTNKVW